MLINIINWIKIEYYIIKINELNYKIFQYSKPSTWDISSKLRNRKREYQEKLENLERKVLFK